MSVFLTEFTFHRVPALRIVLTILKAGVVALLIALQFAVLEQMKLLNDSFQDYVASTPFFASTTARIEKIESFNVSKDDGRVTRYVKLTYYFRKHNKLLGSTCISFGNCAGLEPEELSGVIGRDISKTKANDSLLVYVSALNPKMSFIVLRNVEDVRREVFYRSGFGVVLILLCLLLEFLLLKNIFRQK
jgi:hypothetical protein